MHRQPVTADEASLKCAIINWFPGMPPDLLTSVAANMDAIVVVGAANGALPTAFEPVVRSICDDGVAVIALSDNPSAGHGVVRISDQPQITTMNAGAVFLQKANINDVEAIVDTLRTRFDSGLRGAELTDAVRLAYEYEPDQLPKSILDSLEDRQRYLDEHFGSAADSIEIKFDGRAMEI